MLNKYQKAMLDVISGGDLAHLAEEEDDHKVRQYLREFPDELARFVFVELSTLEDCDSDETALQRMQSMIDDLINVKEAVKSVCQG